jgi:hypothetical protein
VNNFIKNVDGPTQMSRSRFAPAYLSVPASPPPGSTS